MSRFKHEVAEMDRRHGLIVRTISLSVAAVAVIITLWAAGMPPQQWLARVIGAGGISESEEHQQPSAAPLAPTIDAPRPIAATNSLPGTDSSLSTAPLPLYLLGVLPGRSFNEGTAHIGTSIDNPQTCSAGAMLANGSALAEIHADYVHRRGVATRMTRLQRRFNRERSGKP